MCCDLGRGKTRLPVGVHVRQGRQGPRASGFLAVEAQRDISNADLWSDEVAGDFGILVWVLTRGSQLPCLRKMLRDGKQSILLTVSYFAPPDELIEELCRAARRRVKVRLMLPGQG